MKTFDVYSRLETVSRANENLTYNYNTLDHTVSSELDGKAVTTSYSYDEAGNRLTQLDGNNRLIQYQYDALNRVTSADAPGTADDITYGYDTCLNGQGRLCSMAMESGITTYAYDGLGRVTGHQSVGYSYNAAGRTQTVTYPSGSVISYDYNFAGQVQSVNDISGSAIASAISYEAFGPIDGFTYGNGLSYTATFDTANRPTQQATNGLLERSYNQYDANGNLLQLNETRNFSTTLNQFNYDWGDRLETASGLFGTRDFTYESSADYSYSSRGSHDEGSGLFDYEYRTTSFYSHEVNIGDWATSEVIYQLDDPLTGSCWLTIEGCATKTIWTPGTSQASSRVYDYAGAGTEKWIWDWGCVLTPYTAEEITLFGVTDTHYYECSEEITNWGYENSAYNQMTRAMFLEVEQASYQYNALRQRVSKTLADGSVTQYVYGLDGLLLAELDGLNNVIKEYIYLSGKLLAVRDFSAGFEQLYYAHTDHLGMPRLLTNASGQTVWSGDFDPFGKVVAIDEDVDGDTFNVSLNIRFPGQYHDAETGLYYNWNRYYDPEIGQYTSSDPIGIAGGLNTYAYVGGNPVGYIDPYGLRVVGIELNLFGYGLGILADTGEEGISPFEGVSDLGLFVDYPTNGFEDFDIADLAKRLKGSLRFTTAPNRCSFDKDSERFNANLLIPNFTSDTERHTVGFGLSLPFPVTEVEHRTTGSISIGDLFD